jgi:hypothetical protein
MRVVLFILIIISFNLYTQEIVLLTDNEITSGARQSEKYIPLLVGKNVGVIANPTSLIGKKHLIDTLLSLKVNVKKIFSPEHGFRGQTEKGEKVNSQKDEKTGIPIISLYGSHKKPTQEDLKGIDVLVYDNHLQPWMMVECKSMEVKLDESVLMQLLSYHVAIPVDYLVITNGITCHVAEKKNGTAEWVPFFPKYIFS